MESIWESKKKIYCAQEKIEQERSLYFVWSDEERTICLYVLIQPLLPVVVNTHRNVFW